jgi:hypothetical protein
MVKGTFKHTVYNSDLKKLVKTNERKIKEKKIDIIGKKFKKSWGIMKKRSTLSKLKNRHIIMVLRGNVKIPMMTPDRQFVNSNTVIGYLKGFDDEFLYIGQEEKTKDWKMLVRRFDVSAISITPTDEEMAMESLLSEKPDGGLN